MVQEGGGGKKEGCGRGDGGRGWKDGGMFRRGMEGWWMDGGSGGRTGWREEGVENQADGGISQGSDAAAVVIHDTRLALCGHT